MEMYDFVQRFSGKYYLSKSDYLNHDFEKDGQIDTYNFDAHFEEYGGIWTNCGVTTNTPSDTAVSYDTLFKCNKCSFGKRNKIWKWNVINDAGTFCHPIHGYFRDENGKRYWGEIDTLEKWENYPDHGKIGFRGPVIKVDVLKRADENNELPLVYWVDPGTQSDSYHTELEMQNPYSIPDSEFDIIRTL